MIPSADSPVLGCIANSIRTVAGSILEVQEINVYKPSKQTSCFFAVVGVAVPNDGNVDVNMPKGLEPFPKPWCRFSTDEVRVPAPTPTELFNLLSQLFGFVFISVFLPLAYSPVLAVAAADCATHRENCS